jgi:hypothetical protein
MHASTPNALYPVVQVSVYGAVALVVMRFVVLRINYSNSINLMLKAVKIRTQNA